MENYSLPYFGDMNPRKLEEYYDVEIDLSGRKVGLDLNFDEDRIDVTRLDAVKEFIARIPEFDKKNRERIEQDYAAEDGDTVRTYVEHHLDGMEEDALPEIAGNGAATPEQRMVSMLHLVRVGLYPDNESPFAIFDYSIGRSLTQYLVVIVTNEHGEMDYMTRES